MKLGPFSISWGETEPPLSIKATPPLSPLQGSTYWPRVQEPFIGAWQQNLEADTTVVLAYSAAFSCVTLIAADIGKLYLGLVEQNELGIWERVESPAFSPVLRKPNRFQTINKFVEQWIASKLIHGNTYVLKQRDRRGVVVAMYVLDPTRVTPLVAPDGSVYYQLKRDDLSELPTDSVTVPASEIIHDTMVALFHPLIGVSPLFASGLAAKQGLSIQSNSQQFFAKGSLPGGVLTAPGHITQDTADRLKAYWDTHFTGDNVGKVAVLGDNLKYESMHVNAVDAQLIDQLKWTGETVCSSYHVPPYMVGIGPPPPYANIEPLVQQYYSQCLQSLIINFESALDEGLGIGPVFGNTYGTEFDIDDLIWMQTEARSQAANVGIASAALTPNEARKRYFGLGPVKGGDTPYMQQQNFSLAALDKRDRNDPFAKPEPPPDATAATSATDTASDEPPPTEDEMSKFLAALHRASVEEGLYAG